MVGITHVFTESMEKLREMDTVKMSLVLKLLCLKRVRPIISAKNAHLQRVEHAANDS